MESTFGVPVLASTSNPGSSFLPMTNVTMTPDPGLFSPKVMMGYRDINLFPLYGQLKNDGNVEGPIFPSNGIQLLVAAIGVDQTQVGSPASTAANGTLAAASAGATTLTYTVTNGAGPAVGDYIQVGPAIGTFGSWQTPTPSGASFVTQVTAVTGSGPYTLTVPAIPVAVASDAVAQVCVAPFFHSIGTANVLPSLTIEKDAGGYQSLQFGGARVNKYSIKATNGNAEAQVTADLMAQSVNVLDTPTPIFVTPETPFVFAESQIELFNTWLVQATSLSIDIDNSVKATYTYNNSHEAQFITATGRVITGQFDVVYYSYDDATYGYESMMMQGAQGALSISMRHPGSLTYGSEANYGVQITMPAVNLDKYSQALKVDDVIVETFNFTAFVDLPSGGTTAVSAVVANGQYAPYAAS